MVQHLLNLELHFLNLAAVVRTLLSPRALQTMRITINLHYNSRKLNHCSLIQTPLYSNSYSGK